MNETMRWKMFAYMAALFVAGAITGAAVMGRIGAAPQTLKVGRTDEIATMIKQHLSVLELTPDQRDKFDPLIKKASLDLEASHLECLQRSTAVVDALHSQIKMSLTPEQQAKMEQLEQERRAKLKLKYNYPPDGSRASNP